MKKKPLAGGRVGVHGDYRNAGGDGTIDIVFQQGRISHRDQDPAGFALHCLLQRLLLSLGIVGVRTRELGTHLELLGRLKQTGRASLPVRNLDVGGNQVILFVGIVPSSTADQENQQDAEDDSGRYREVAHRILLANRRDRAQPGAKRYEF